MRAAAFLYYYLAQTRAAERPRHAQRDAQARAASRAPHTRTPRRGHRARRLPAVATRRVRTLPGGGSP